MLPLVGGPGHGGRFVDAFTESHHEGRFAMLNLVPGSMLNLGGTACLVEALSTGSQLGIGLSVGFLAVSGLTAAALVNEDNLHKYI